MRIPAALAVCMVTFTVVAANAQAIQQPVVGTTAIGTTVSVPDRGRVQLGGVQRGAAGRVSTGPFRSGTNTGRSHQASGMSTTVWIHDLREMDEQLLNQPVARESATRLSPKAEHAARSLSHGSQNVAMESADKYGSNDESSEAVRYLKRGQESMAAGKIEVAKVYLRLAVDRGSTEAAQELRHLPQRVVARTPAR